ncbi:MAG: serine/threonine protein kinase [Pleurocapsa sp.]
MSIKFTKLCKVLAIATIASLVSLETQAEEISLSQAFETAYYKNGENAFRQSGILGQINTIIGIPKFPEQDIAADGKEVHKIYELGLKLQTSREPLITRDLDNPYDTSLRENSSFGLSK